jgi:hypothetical protein
MGAHAGDIVRFELAPESFWFYCRVDGVRDDGGLLCTVVDAQSWPDLILAGVLPGRQYALPRERVLSIVRQAN